MSIVEEQENQLKFFPERFAHYFWRRLNHTYTVKILQLALSE